MNKKQKSSTSKVPNKDSFNDTRIAKDFLITAEELNITERIDPVKARRLMEKNYKRK